jgi:[ribosomal protein S5]-alanine N-acetyltransferase
VYPVRIAGDGTSLREFRSDDVDDALAIVGDDRVTTWLAFDSRTREQALATVNGAVERAKLDPREEYYFAITRRNDDQLIGFIRLGLAGEKAAKLGYAIAADHWGNGYATDAARQMLQFGFDTLGLHRISAAIGPSNLSSIAVVKRLGFAYEGRIRHHVHTNGDWRDSLLYSILVDDWSRLNAPEVDD